MYPFSETFNGTDSIVSSYAEVYPLAAQTNFIWVVPRTTTAQYWMSATQSAGTSGFRIAINSSNQWQFGMDSSGTAGSPNRATSANPTLGALNKFASTFDGSLNGTGINLWLGIDSGPMVLDNGTASAGTTALSNIPLPINFGNRAGGGATRASSGFGFVYARWNWVLPEMMIQMIDLCGPLSVPEGLVFFRANGIDWSSNGYNAVLRTNAPFGEFNSVWVPEVPDSAVGELVYTASAAVAGANRPVMGMLG